MITCSKCGSKVGVTGPCRVCAKSRLATEQAKGLSSRGISSLIIEAVARDDARAAGQIVDRLRAIGVTYDEAAAMFASVCPKCERGEFESLMYRADEISNDMRQQKEDARG